MEISDLGAVVLGVSMGLVAFLLTGAPSGTDPAETPVGPCAPVEASLSPDTHDTGGTP